VLLSPPDFFSIKESKNPFMRAGTEVNALLAMRQWQSLRAAFQRAGVEVLLAEPDPLLEDMCFCASQAFVGVDDEERSFAVPGRMLHASRRGEVERIARWYSNRGYRIIDLDLRGEDFLEGAGDLLWTPDWSAVWAGFGHRSTRSAVEQFTASIQAMGFEVRPLELVDAHFYHLNLCFAPLTGDAVLLYPGAFAPQTVAAVRKRAHTYEVSREDALQFVCNGVCANGFYITARLSRSLEHVLGIEGIEPVLVDLSEFHKAGGSVASLKMLLP
jgi:N-dimethylarginine dimethylaminohydrolase